MTEIEPERWRRVKEICNSALERKPEDREPFLQHACASDESLRGEVDSLLALAPQAEQFIRFPVLEEASRSILSESISTASDLTGQTILHYRITARIGEGGMGVVYRAEDVRLGRVVAIKFLSEKLSQGRHALERFQREARAASALNHPHICTLHDVGEHEGRTFLVMEHLAGETLSAALTKGPLSLDKALEIGSQVADALDAAHKQGIVHRDLKPGNVVLTKTGAKLLDFGLAKLKPAPLPPGEGSPAAPEPETTPGTVLGTVPYMAPEQLEGKTTDARTDIFAFGAVLYEVITGKRAFPGESPAGIISAIMSAQPAAMSMLQPMVPSSLDRVVKRCLAKEPDARWQSAMDVADELRWIKEGGADATPVPQHSHSLALRRSFLLAAVLLLGAAAGAVLWRLLATAPIRSVSRLNISLSASGLVLAPWGAAISPDGQTIVFAASAPDGQRLYMRRLDGWACEPLSESEAGYDPFFSPDGGSVAFLAEGKLKKARLGGGATETICSVPIQSSGGTWGTDGRIVFSQLPNGGICRVAAEPGGKPEWLLRPGDNAYYLNPELVPGANSILFTVVREGRQSISSLSLETRQVREKVVEPGGTAQLVFKGRAPHLLYQSEGRLYAVAFDPDKLERRGTPRVVVEGVGAVSLSSRQYGVSSAGTLMYTSTFTTMSRLVWKDRSGRTAPLDLKPRRYSFPSLSPDGRLVSVTVSDDVVQNLWTGSVSGEPLSRLTFGNSDMFSVFAEGTGRVVFTSGQGSQHNIFWTPVDGSGKASPLSAGPNALKPTSWTANGRVILFNDNDERGGKDIGQMEVDRPSATRAFFLKTPFNELEGVFSPDGRFVAYQSDESGRWEVYIRPYPGPGPQEQVSMDGGLAPAWNPKGGELFFQTATSLMAVRVEEGKRIGAPVRLFTWPRSREYRREYDVSPDGQRFLMLERADPDGAAPQINLVLNWFEEL